ncbi:alpha-hydroxy acid oxidase [Prescottella agglutinans]|uniref:Isopentenyl diphosphate isomerase/L-lactate dehydrogenase-like FMN-dependent dehydrogenase n=1 Tax=Prescottella agglutinans TaxID=1644129 RepID=A0ABT6M917_9NOCA|nr:alpha-hydroxy acid oxidase [Prescottella agglutinans]MDH6280251.1 isopentenyl diphosphate isomerase/L-lactate dehydrogenase-like FMN-dependent dehydrogenase [Prescottella agglutinans]
MRAFGFDWRWQASGELLSVEDYRRAASRRLPHMVWAYVEGGADDLRTVAGNRSAFDDWWLVPSVLAGHDTHDLAAEVAGMPVSMPVLTAPTGFNGLTRWSGDLDAIRAAERVGTRCVVSTASTWSVEEIADAAGEPHAFQLYPGSGGVAAALMRRAWDAGFRSLFVTVDVPTVGNREGEKRAGMGVPPVLTPRRLLDVTRHSRWAYDVVRHKRIGGRNLASGDGVTAALASIEVQERHLVQSRLNWDDLAWMRDNWKGRLYIKGVLRAEDAVSAVDLGLDGVVVSNHGGRQLDGCIPTVAALPAVADAVAGRAEVFLDGGIRRGTDVIKALALGADAVLIGRPCLYGMAVAGDRGVEDVLTILRAEIERALTLLGVRDIRDLDRAHVRPAALGDQNGISMPVITTQ